MLQKGGGGRGQSETAGMIQVCWQSPGDSCLPEAWHKFKAMAPSGAVFIFCSTLLSLFVKMPFKARGERLIWSSGLLWCETLRNYASLWNPEPQNTAFYSPPKQRNCYPPIPYLSPPNLGCWEQTRKTSGVVWKSKHFYTPMCAVPDIKLKGLFWWMNLSFRVYLLLQGSVGFSLGAGWGSAGTRIPDVPWGVTQRPWLGPLLSILIRLKSILLLELDLQWPLTWKSQWPSVSRCLSEIWKADWFLCSQPLTIPTPHPPFFF